MKKGVLILGHGSRRQDANEGLKQLAAMVQANLGMQVVPAYFQFARPSLDEGVASFVNDGVKEIIIVPSLLFPGIHLKEDIPEALEKLKQQYGSEVCFHLTPPIGLIPAWRRLSWRECGQRQSLFLKMSLKQPLTALYPIQMR